MRTRQTDDDWTECPECGLECLVDIDGGDYECQCGHEGNVYYLNRRVLVLEDSSQEGSKDRLHRNHDAATK